MVRALTKIHRNGEPYQRRPAVDQCLVEAVRQAPAALRARALILDPEQSQYLPSEALVHLARRALRMNDETTASALIGCLGRRSETNLRRTIRPSPLFDAADVRSATLCKLYDLFVDELADPNRDTLDYYEAQFNDAFLTLRNGVLRATLRHADRFPPPVPPPARDSVQGDEESPEAEEWADESSDGDPVLQADAHNLLRRIQALPPLECEAVFWKWAGYKVEADDPTEKTIATLCRVTGRAVRDRLASAKARLIRMEEEDET